MTKTSVGADLLESLEVLTELGVDTVGEDLEVLAVDNVALSVEEPGGDLVLGGVLDDGDDTLELFGGELTGAVRALDWFVALMPPSFFFHGISVPLVEVDIGLLADQVGVATTHTLYLSKGIHDCRSTEVSCGCC